MVRAQSIELSTDLRLALRNHRHEEVAGSSEGLRPYAPGVEVTECSGHVDIRVRCHCTSSCRFAIAMWTCLKHAGYSAMIIDLCTGTG